MADRNAEDGVVAGEAMTNLDSKQSLMRDRQETKRCNRCTRTKPVTEFYKGTGYADGRWAKCKDCVRKRNATYKKSKRATLPQDAPGKRASTGLTTTPPALPDRPSASARAISEPSPACLCSLTVAVKDGQRLYGTNPACPLPEHRRIIGGYEPHKAQKSGAEVKYNGMVHGY